MRLPSSATALSSLLALALAGSAATTTYTVRRGDTLSAIASRTGRSVGELAAANRLRDPNRIYEGQHLTVPERVALAVASPSAPLRLISAPERLDLVPLFRRWSAANGLPVDLLMAMTWLESGWQNSVVSGKGALGIGQLMPATVDFVRSVLIGVDGLDPGVPEHNIRMSARYLGWLIKQAGGDVRLALAGYYQGPRSVRDRGPIPATVAYVDGVLGLRPGFATLVRR
ncbi:MAG: LysM peptidoglycan-binding domain-containing protein [Acidobacteria bacterium]|nr:LysM peptidoglycan-binding domain-containing protein [Acidobacteriota bacterium]